MRSVVTLFDTIREKGTEAAYVVIQTQLADYTPDVYIRSKSVSKAVNIIIMYEAVTYF